MYILS